MNADMQYNEMQYIWENERLQTFMNWPKEHFVSSRDLAAAGFVFLGSQDNVRCAFCGGFLHDWEGGDIPINIHRTFFPCCPFVLYYEGKVGHLDWRKSPYYRPEFLHERFEMDGPRSAAGVTIDQQQKPASHETDAPKQQQQQQLQQQKQHENTETSPLPQSTGHEHISSTKKGEIHFIILKLKLLKI